MVIFQAPGGSPGYNQFESLDEAVAFVESLRNEQEVTSARMFALEEIKFELKPYFKVELQALNAGPAPAAAPPEPAAAPEPAPAPEPEVEAEPVAAAPAPQPAPDPAAGAGVPAPAPEPEPASTFGAFTDRQPAPPPPAVPAPPPQAEPDPPKDQPARRGLFGR